ncbi:hypothetical protein SS05631_b53880 (plasmid) [Sinorhizobium sp. CCBAU 05631]|nr:hypothetical protein SS05631_b53880 [Sinorhizobium sp. CCBAU 05631]
MARGAWPAQMVQQHPAHGRIARGAGFGRVLMSHNEQRHRDPHAFRQDRTSIRGNISCGIFAFAGYR